jgi:hypothetical protein
MSFRAGNYGIHSQRADCHQSVQKQERLTATFCHPTFLNAVSLALRAAHQARNFTRPPQRECVAWLFRRLTVNWGRPGLKPSSTGSAPFAALWQDNQTRWGLTGRHLQLSAKRPVNAIPVNQCG